MGYFCPEIKCILSYLIKHLNISLLTKDKEKTIV